MLMEKKLKKAYAIKAFVVYNGKILLLWNPKYRIEDKWDAPGGKKERGESDADTLHREIREVCEKN